MAIVRGLLSKPGTQYPKIPGLGKPHPVEFTAEFLARLHANGFKGVPVNLMHVDRSAENVVGKILDHKIQDLALHVEADVGSGPKGKDVEAQLVAGIALGQGIQVSFELDDIKWKRPPLEAVAAGESIVPLDAKVGAVSLVDVGACGPSCAFTKLVAHQEGSSCCDSCKTGKGCEGGNDISHAPTFSLVANMEADSAAAVQAKGADKESAAKKTDKAAEAAKGTDARDSEVLQLRKELEDARAAAKAKGGEPAPAEKPKEVQVGGSDKLVESLKQEVQSLKDREEAAERAAVLDSIKELAPKDLKVDEKAPVAVLQAQLAVLASVKGKDPKAMLMAARYGGAQRGTAIAEGEAKPAKDAELNQLFAERLHPQPDKATSRIPVYLRNYVKGPQLIGGAK